jgi:CheY-like chemotaxis protein
MRKRVEAELEQSRDAALESTRAKSEFLANMSHEIRTPLNGVMGMTDLVLETELTREQREYLETVKLSSDSLLTVINDVLDFSKIEAGKIDLEAIDFNLRDCLESTLKTLALRADEKGLELLCEVSPDVPETMQGDSSRLRQIVTNLVGNAIKFTDKGEVAVKVQVQAENGHYRLLQFTVLDTGIGIAEDKRDSILTPFAQADSSTTRKYGGTGLGLTISARLAAMMGGTLWVESELGRGSQFHFTAQLKAADAEKINGGRSAPPEILRGVKVLIVDDNRTNLRILEGMLSRWEMKAVCVQSGEEALAQLSAAGEAGEPYGLILTDMHMPKIDGFALVERIRQRPELSTATIMMLTSAGHRGDALRCQELGVAAYLLKPIRRSELREAIARALGAGEKTGVISLITRHSLQGARGPMGSLRVLLAEDNPVNQLLATRLLEKRGHRVVVAANGREALAALEKESYDLVFMDIQMPDMDGIEATAAIRERENSSGKHQPVIALTAHAMKGDQERCLDAGMDDYLSKPIQPHELDDILEKYIGRRMEAVNMPQDAARGERKK